MITRSLADWKENPELNFERDLRSFPLKCQLFCLLLECWFRRTLNIVQFFGCAMHYCFLAKIEILTLLRDLTLDQTLQLQMHACMVPKRQKEFQTESSRHLFHFTSSNECTGHLKKPNSVNRNAWNTTRR